MPHIINIGDREVGEGRPVFVIAEAGVNHNGDIGLAKRLIDAAGAAGADAVKFQLWGTERFITKAADRAEYQKLNVGVNETQYEMLERLKLSEESHRQLKAYAERKGIMLLSTPHSCKDDIDFLQEIGVQAIKIASGDLINKPLLEHAAKTSLPIIMSSGMATLEEAKEAVGWVKGAGNELVIMLHCTTSYPCPLKDVNLRVIKTMQKELDCLVGYSDHTVSITVPAMAVSMGAVVIEKHFTLDKGLPGPDHRASLEPDELKNMIEEIKDAEKALGSSEKKPTRGEEKIAAVIRKSLIAERHIEKGSVIREGDISVKRPASGIEPKHIDDVIGRTARTNIKKDEPVTWDKISRD